MTTLLNTYREARKAHDDADAKLSAMCKAAEDGGNYNDADEFRNYEYAEHVQDAARAANALLDVLLPAVERMAESLGNPEVSSEASLTCGEANRIARLMVIVGHVSAAANFLVGHAEHDDEGDDHGAMADEDYDQAAEYARNLPLIETPED